ncbi:hypothetical protein [Caulobacter sp. RL271]|jgi:hypothetical protein|uniref:DUF1648 domain-containing protein n=1 Tax=Caulobacter segnis TaxID=88688 RepID=A0ABY4ZQC2_9CAUL|nr:hypothetical protein [Caulobacter segnis]USQ94811.1 hypothetical protein MZV50_19880 [Caulobacter segnis]
MTQAVVAIVAIVTLGLLTAMSLRANRRFKRERQLPMQWWLDGSVTWTAPRPVALAFMPVLAAVCLAPALFLKPKPGQEHLAIPVVILTALVILGVHALHLWLIRGTVQGRS